MQPNVESFRQSLGLSFKWDGSLETVENYLVRLTPADLRKHVLIIGATGSGKTNLIHHLIAKDILRGHSIAVLDLRGDLANSVLEICAGNIDPRIVACIDLREKVRPFGFNPLFGTGLPYFRALCLLAVLQSESESWGIQLSETLRCALMVLAECYEPITRLERLLYDHSYRAECLSRCTEEPVITFWQRFEKLSSDKQHALAMPVLNKISLLLATKTLRNILGHPEPINLGDHLGLAGSVLTVSCAVDELHGAGRMMGSLILNSICHEMFSRVCTSESERNPVRLYVDEFEHFTMPEFETILAEGRRFGLSLVLAHQTLAQISPKMRSLILGNVGTKFVFHCGREDEATLCRDVFGAGMTFDFSQLDVGEAVLWQRGKPHDFIEINEPIIHDTGEGRSEARHFVQQVHSRVTPIAEFERDMPVIHPRISAEAIISAEMEEWL